MEEIFNYAINEGGSNFSLGQRQLICMARALIKKPRILIMDEATASIDEATDNKIQEMIRTEFNNVTVLTIAHRLRTIIEYDRIMVLEDGELVSFDTPLNLIQAGEGIFHTLINENAPEFFNEMKNLADQKQRNK